MPQLPTTTPTTGTKPAPGFGTTPTGSTTATYVGPPQNVLTVYYTKLYTNDLSSIANYANYDFYNVYVVLSNLGYSGPINSSSTFYSFYKYVSGTTTYGPSTVTNFIVNQNVISNSTTVMPFQGMNNTFCIPLLQVPINTSLANITVGFTIITSTTPNGSTYTSTLDKGTKINVTIYDIAGTGLPPVTISNITSTSIYTNTKTFNLSGSLSLTVSGMLNYIQTDMNSYQNISATVTDGATLTLTTGNIERTFNSSTFVLSLPNNAPRIVPSCNFYIAGPSTYPNYPSSYNYYGTISTVNLYETDGSYNLYKVTVTGITSSLPSYVTTTVTGYFIGYGTTTSIQTSIPYVGVTWKLKNSATYSAPSATVYYDSTSTTWYLFNCLPLTLDANYDINNFYPTFKGNLYNFPVTTTNYNFFNTYIGTIFANTTLYSSISTSGNIGYYFSNTANGTVNYNSTSGYVMNYNKLQNYSVTGLNTTSVTNSTVVSISSSKTSVFYIGYPIVNPIGSFTSNSLTASSYINSTGYNIASKGNTQFTSKAAACGTNSNNYPLTIGLSVGWLANNALIYPSFNNQYLQTFGIFDIFGGTTNSTGVYYCCAVAPSLYNWTLSTQPKFIGFMYDGYPIVTPFLVSDATTGTTRVISRTDLNSNNGLVATVVLPSSVNYNTVTTNSVTYDFCYVAVNGFPYTLRSYYGKPNNTPSSGPV
jgi:hypothetical protein